MNRTTPVLLAALVVASCGLVYELLAATVASWVLGDSVTQFSVVIGLYLSSLGAGSYLSKHFERDLPRRFVQLELAVALVGGMTAPLLFLAAGDAGRFRAVLYATVVASGTLVGLEMPILLRIVNAHEAFRDSVARVLAYDHAGSLLGSLVFSLVLVPAIGPMRTGIVFGMLNALVAFVTTYVLRESVAPARALRVASAAVLVLLLAALLRADAFIARIETAGAASDGVTEVRA